MGGTTRRRLQCANHHLFHLRVGDLPGRADARLVEQPGDAIGDKARPPLTHRDRRHPQPARHGLVFASLGAGQYDPRPPGDGWRRPRSMRQRFQFSSFLGGQHQRCLGPASTHARFSFMRKYADERRFISQTSVTAH